MTRDDIIKLAREAGDDVEHTLPSDLDFLERFSALVAAAEREACAKVCESHAADAWDHEGGALACADRIRARGES